jgi:hypothetical protein
MTEAEKVADKKRRNREAQERYREANREKILARQREYRAANPEKTRLQREQSMKRWKERNPEKAIAKYVLRYEAVGDRERAASRLRAQERRERDREAAREYDRKYRAENLERMRAQARARYARRKQLKAAGGNAQRTDGMPDVWESSTALGLVPPRARPAGALDRADLLAGVPRDPEGAADG